MASVSPPLSPDETPLNSQVKAAIHRVLDSYLGESFTEARLSAVRRLVEETLKTQFKEPGLPSEPQCELVWDKEAGAIKVHVFWSPPVVHLSTAMPPPTRWELIMEDPPNAN